MLAIKANNFTEAWVKAYYSILAHGEERSPRGMLCRDVADMIIEVKQPQQRTIIDEHRNAYFRPAAAEFAWYMTANPLVQIITPFIKKWSDFSDDGLTVNSNYGVTWENSIPDIIQLLKDDPDTRRAQIAIYANKYLKYRGKDTPCTSNLTFSIVNGELRLSVLMRSNDLHLGATGTDWFCFSVLQELVANQLQLKIGTYTHHAVSMHLYQRSIESHICAWKNPLEPHSERLLLELDEVSERHHANNLSIDPFTTFENFWKVEDPYFFANPLCKQPLTAEHFKQYLKL